MSFRLTGNILLVVVAMCCGCARNQSSITSVPMSPWIRGAPDGMPFYLPKPLLIVAKNVRHIDECKIGLTNPAPIPNAFDNQAAYADLKANVTVPGSEGESKPAVDTGETALPGSFSPAATAYQSAKEELLTPSGRVQDSLTPDTFFTYQIVFIPDLAQKYGLRIQGKPGEVRVAMNLVNGWMYTGMGPYYLKDSSTAQNCMAVGVATMFAGRGASQVVSGIAGIAGASASGGGTQESAAAGVNADSLLDKFSSLAEAIKSETAVPSELLNYSEIHIYEPMLDADGQTGWRLIAHHDFSRQFLRPGNTGELLRELLPALTGTRTGGSVTPSESLPTPGPPEELSAPGLPPLSPSLPEDGEPADN